jgi:hypothetical protein
MSASWQIPLCRSEFLQDFCERLKPHLKARGWRSFYADVDTCEDEDESLERLRVLISTYTGAEVCLNSWEDKDIWIRLAALPKTEDNFKIDFYPDFALLGFERLVEALVETVSISTRLNYDESPEPLLRQIWNFSGEVNIEGVS